MKDGAMKDGAMKDGVMKDKLVKSGRELSHCCERSRITVRILLSIQII